MSTGLVVIDREGVEHPGWKLRAGDLIVRTDYDFARQMLTVTVGDRPVPLRLRLRRWWEGRR